MQTASSFRPLVIAVVEAPLAEVSGIAQVLHAHGVPYLLQVLETPQHARRFFAQLVGDDRRCPDLLLLDDTLPGLDTRVLVPWMRAVPACRHLRMLGLTGAGDPTSEQEVLALGADAVFQKPMSFQQFLALGDLIKAVLTDDFG